MDISDITKKYPTSKNGHKCVGPCYYPNTVSVHPIYLTHIKGDTINAYCPTTAYTIAGETKPRIFDECAVPTQKKNESENVEMLSLSPVVEFNDSSFLKIYYEIYSLENAIKWIIDHNYMPMSNLNRILNIALKVHGDKQDIIDNRIVDYIGKIFKQHIKTITEHILDYVDVKNDKVTLVKTTTTPNKYINEKIQYLETMFINNEVIYKFIIRYFKARKNEWKNIDNHIARMINDMGHYIETKIKLTLKI